MKLISIILLLFLTWRLDIFNESGKVTISGTFDLDKVDESKNNIYVVDSLTQDTIFQKEFINKYNNKQDKYSIELQYDKNYIIIFSNSEYCIINKTFVSTTVNGKHKNIDRLIHYNKILWISNDNDRIRYNNLTGTFEVIPIPIENKDDE